MPITLPNPFGRYRLYHQLGEGGMGAVFLAEDLRMGRHVALKVPHLSAQQDPQTIERFYREARIAGQILHPNLCPVFDVDCIDGIHFLTMAYIEGTPLSQLIHPGHPWSPGRALPLIVQLAGGLQVLHQRGIVHRDLKPSNVLIQAEDKPVLVDFGLARSVQPESNPLTLPGQILGTPAYLAPEQIHNAPLSPATDVYALGVLLFQMLTGQLPFAVAAPVQMMARVLYDPVPSPAKLCPGIHPQLDNLCLRMMAKQPEDRPANLPIVIDQLNQILRGTARATTVEAPAIQTLPTSSALETVITLPVQAAVQATEPIVNSLGMRLVWIPAGAFVMGSPSSELDPYPDESPPHRVEITRPFWLGAWSVTQDEYQRVMGTNPSWFSATGGAKGQVWGMNTGRFPVETVSWFEAMQFCQRLSEVPVEKASRRRYRLATEAEWEYACRAGASRFQVFSCGNTLTGQQANFNGNFPFGDAPAGTYLERTTVVGSYPANAWGLYDMHGNVWEWCSDWYGSDYYLNSEVRDPTGPAKGDRRVLRGGSWSFDGWNCRSATRYRSDPAFRSRDLGFRIVCEITG